MEDLTVLLFVIGLHGYVFMLCHVAIRGSRRK